MRNIHGYIHRKLFKNHKEMIKIMAHNVRVPPSSRFGLQYHLLGFVEFLRIQQPVTKILGAQYPTNRRQIEIDITYLCNLQCINCNRSCKQAPTNEHMSSAQIQHFIEESRIKGIHWRNIRLIGGEPTLNPEFFDILNIILEYKHHFSPDTNIQIVTNGHGLKVQGVLDGIPEDVEICNSHKDGPNQSFESFNVAPQDKIEYTYADFTNACWITEWCGMGLTPYGYYPCAIAGSIDRIFGYDLGKKHLPSDDEDFTDALRALCCHCGHFKRLVEKPIDIEIQSKTWKSAYEQYRNKNTPKLTKY